MHKIVNSLSFIADAAEYFDRKTGAAWRIRSNLTNSVVWAANAHLRAVREGTPERIVSTMIVLATLRCWTRDCNTSSFVLDLTPTNVAKTLGLEKVVDLHAEACRMARNKCMTTRNALRFKEFYDASLGSLEAQRNDRAAAVEDIANLLADSGFTVDADAADVLTSFHDMPCQSGDFIADSDLYDNNAVERQIDTLSEVVGNALESMYDVCDRELGSAITADKIARLTGYDRAIKEMMNVVGVDTKKLAERRARLEAQIDAAALEIEGNQKLLDAQIAEQMNAMAQAAAEPHVKPKRTRVKASA